MTLKPRRSKLSKLNPLNILISLGPSTFTIPTWLLIGATLQCLLLAILPRNMALLPPVFSLLLKLIRSQLQAAGYLHNPHADGVHFGVTSSQYPTTSENPNARSSSSITILVLSAYCSHPNGFLSPGSSAFGKYFRQMWRDAHDNRSKYGFLGNTQALIAEKDELGIYGPVGGEHQEGKTVVFLSYWKTLDGLHAFAAGEVHRKGWLWWEKGANKKFKHIGISHEVYEVPAGSWENIYHNFPKFAIGNATFSVTDEEGGTEGKGEARWVDGLRSVKGKEWKNMEARMGRPAGSLGFRKREFNQ